MNKKAKFLTRLLTLVLTLLLLGAVVEPAYAQRRKEDTKSKSVIPEEKQPKLFLAWIAGAVLAAATVALGIKNSRRSHLD